MAISLPGGFGGGIQTVDELPERVEDGSLVSLETDYSTVPDTGLRWVSGAVSASDPDRYGFASATAAPWYGLQAAGSLEGGADIEALFVERDTRYVYLIAQEDLNLAALHFPSGRHAIAEVTLAGSHAIRQGGYRLWRFRWANGTSLSAALGLGLADGATRDEEFAVLAAGIDVRIEDDNGHFLSPDGLFIDASAVTVHHGLYQGFDGEWRRLPVEVVDELPRGPTAGRIAYLTKEHDLLYDTHLRLRTVQNFPTEPDYTSWEYATTLGTGLMLRVVGLRAGGSLEGASDANIPAIYIDVDTHGTATHMDVIAQEDLTLAAFHHGSNRVALTQQALQNDHRIRAAGYRVWRYQFAHSPFHDLGLAQFLRNGGFNNIDIRLEDSDGNFLASHGEWVADGAVQSRVLPGYYLSKNLSWVQFEGGEAGPPETVGGAHTLSGNRALDDYAMTEKLEADTEYQFVMQRGSDDEATSTTTIFFGRDLLNLDPNENTGQLSNNSESDVIALMFGRLESTGGRNLYVARKDRGDAEVDTLRVCLQSDASTYRIKELRKLPARSGGSGAVQGVADSVGVLRTELETEKVARAQGDTAERTARIAAIDAEAALRASGDQTLMDLITALDDRQRRETEDIYTVVTEQAELDAIPTADGRFHWAYVQEALGEYLQGDVLFYVGAWRIIPSSVYRNVSEAEWHNVGDAATSRPFPPSIASSSSCGSPPTSARAAWSSWRKTDGGSTRGRTSGTSLSDGATTGRRNGLAKARPGRREKPTCPYPTGPRTVCASTLRRAPMWTCP